MGVVSRVGRESIWTVEDSRQRLDCVRFRRRFGCGIQAATGWGLPCRSEGKAVLQAHALQTLSRLLIHRSEATGFLPQDSVKNFSFRRLLGSPPNAVVPGRSPGVR